VSGPNQEKEQVIEYLTCSFVLRESENMIPVTTPFCTIAVAVAGVIREVKLID
jgi:hypothetical protein